MCGSSCSCGCWVEDVSGARECGSASKSTLLEVIPSRFVVEIMAVEASVNISAWLGASVMRTSAVLFIWDIF